MKNPEFNKLAKIVGLPPWITNDTSNHDINLGDRIEQFAILVHQNGLEMGYEKALEDFRNEIMINVKRIENV